MHSAQQPTLVGYLYVHTSFHSALFGLCFQDCILKPMRLWVFYIPWRHIKLWPDFSGAFTRVTKKSKLPHWESSPGILLQWLVLALPNAHGAPEVKAVTSSCLWKLLAKIRQISYITVTSSSSSRSTTCPWRFSKTCFPHASAWKKGHLFQKLTARHSMLTSVNS